MRFQEILQSQTLILDGAMGTMLQKAGLPPGENPNLWNLANPEAVQRVHEAYLSTGARLILTNTFGANRRKLGAGFADVAAKGVEIAKRAAKPYGALVALDVGPLGELLAPMGELTFDEAYEIFKEQIIAGAEAGADAIYIETITDLAEARCALLAAKENTGLPVLCSMSFEKNGRTFMGVPLAAMALTLEGLGADVLGINCSVGPAEAYAMAEELLRWTRLPLAVKPNAGLPKISGGETVYETTAEEFALEMANIAGLGVFALGGCCGTTPEYIRRIAELSRPSRPVQEEAPPAICTATKVLRLDGFCLAGTRMSPASENIRQALREQNWDILIDEALAQADDGADLVCLAAEPGEREAETLKEAVAALQGMAPAPLCLVSADLAALEAGLRAYHGKVMVYMPCPIKTAQSAFWRLCKKYGAAVVVPVAGENEAVTAEERLGRAKTLAETANTFGVSRSNLFVDVSAGADSDEPAETLRAIALARGQGIRTAVYAIGRGLDREFMEKARQAGLSLAFSDLADA